MSETVRSNANVARPVTKTPADVLRGSAVVLFAALFVLSGWPERVAALDHIPAWVPFEVLALMSAYSLVRVVQAIVRCGSSGLGVYGPYVAMLLFGIDRWGEAASFHAGVIAFLVILLADRIFNGKPRALATATTD